MPDDPGPQPTRRPETERKFEVDDAAAAPDFAGVGPVTGTRARRPQVLDAVYFDTPTGDLATHHITLRRRRGGSDAGWHLKVPAGADTRTEVRVGAGADDEDVPAELRDLVLALVRDRPLVPVAHIVTTRTVELLYGGDVVLAEFCDDRVRASAPDSGDRRRWREWELELTAGDAAMLDPLSRRVLDAGGRPAAHGSKLARALGREGPAAAPRTDARDPILRAVAEQVDRLLVCDRAVRSGEDDAVHQMRVATRKLRALGRTVVGADDRWLLDELRQLAAVLGRARDAEVLAERYRDALDRLPSALVRGPVRQRLVDGAAAEYARGLRESLALMRSPRYFRLLDGLDELVARAPEGRPGLTAAHRRVRKAAKAARRATGTDRDAALHRVRKAAKRLRYLADAADEPTVARDAKAVQTLLGDHQDSVVSRAALRRQAAAAHRAGEDTFTYGILHQQEAALARRRRAELGAALARLRDTR